MVFAVLAGKSCQVRRAGLGSCTDPPWLNPAMGLVFVGGFGAAAKVWSGKF
jgi:hypothetical protein